MGDAEPVLVNAAGVAEFGDFSEMSLASVEGQVQTNLMAPLVLCHEIIPWMLASGGGRIVNVLSVAATHAFPGAVAYGAAKAGLLMAGRCLAAEYRRHGIRVTSVLPGATDTPLWGAGGPDRADMLAAQAVADLIADIVDMPSDRNVDEITLMPPKGIL
jgi:NAD(P)-dependent dehydrogenase (short-subunit alcohol dehydrogenase family)